MDTQIKTISQYIEQDAVKKRIESILKDKSSQFIMSVLSLTNGNDRLKMCEPSTIFIAALLAASLDLPINQNLGYAYILPYKDRNKGFVAQFQLGYKGLIQLAQRSGYFTTINVTNVKEGEIKSFDRLTGKIKLKDIENREQKKTIGYIAYFRLKNGFEKSMFMSNDELMTHAGKYSQSFKNGNGLWIDDFDAMANKTVVKLLLSKYAPMSVDMNKGVTSDQAVLKDLDDPEYIDNEVISVEDKAKQNMINRVLESIRTCASVEILDNISKDYPDTDEIQVAINARINELKQELK